MTDIIPLTKDDFEDWLPLWRDYQTFYHVEIPEETTRLTYARLTDREEPMGGFIARDGSQAVGIVHWIMHRSCWRAGDSCYLEDLYVASNARGVGVGRNLIEAVFDVARSDNCARVYWLTHETNTQAMLLYDQVAAKSGFLHYSKRFE